MSEADDRRRYQVRSEILKQLDGASGYALGETSLQLSLNLFVEPITLLAEFRRELQYLEDHGLITIIASSLGGPRRIRLTDDGRAEVAAHHTRK